MRVGVAVSDPGERVASPVCVLPAQEVLSGAKPFRRVLEDWEPELLLCGLPYTLAGEEGPQAARIREAARRIGAACKLPVEFTDERLSSKEAKRSLREKGMTEKAMRGKVDMIAASLFLQAWLDARAGAASNGAQMAMESDAAAADAAAAAITAKATVKAVAAEAATAPDASTAAVVATDAAAAAATAPSVESAER